MKKFTELSKNELIQLNGGESFAYRAGQACAIIWDLTFGGLTGVIDTKGGIAALYSWFG
jgi:hypothetical protein